MGEFSIMHWLVVGVVFMLLFGPKKLPEIGKALGEGIREFKKSMREASTDEVKKDGPVKVALIEGKTEK